jgi:NADH dehydrogenase FAD-containing subunit
VEAGPGILGSFDRDLADHYERGLKKRKVDVRTSTGVTSIVETEIDGHHSTFAELSDGSKLPFGAMVWSAGLQQVRVRSIVAMLDPSSCHCTATLALDVKVILIPWTLKSF